MSGGAWRHDYPRDCEHCGERVYENDGWFENIARAGAFSWHWGCRTSERAVAAVEARKAAA